MKVMKWDRDPFQGVHSFISVLWDTVKCSHPEFNFGLPIADKMKIKKPPKCCESELREQPQRPAVCHSSPETDAPRMMTSNRRSDHSRASETSNLLVTLKTLCSGRCMQIDKRRASEEKLLISLTVRAKKTQKHTSNRKKGTEANSKHESYFRLVSLCKPFYMLQFSI